MKHLFFGGIHPKYNKEMSTKNEHLLTVTPKQVVIPMLQHIGAPCTPLVQVGDHVLRGQKIGDGEWNEEASALAQLYLGNILEANVAIVKAYGLAE